MGSSNVLRAALSLVAIAWHNARAANAWLTLDGTSYGTRSAPPLVPVHRHGRSLDSHLVAMPRRPLSMVRGESSRWGGASRAACCYVPRSWMGPTVVPLPRRRRRRHDRSKHSACSLVVLAAAATPRPPVTGGTFVEGDDFGSSLEDEIEAMGGDAFFLEGYGSRNWGPASATPDQATTEADFSEGSVDVDEGWDGVVDDNAHFDFD